jgi:hypothetical protein
MPNVITKEIPRLSTAYLARSVMEVYQAHKQEDIPDKRIWRKYLKPQFGISYRTFLRYLDMPFDRIIKEALSSEDRAEDDSAN